jgi:HlyD family secretion protein
MDSIMEWLRAGFTAVMALFGADPSAQAVYYGYVEGEYARVAPREGGALRELRVARGDSATAGQILYVLEQDNEKAMRDDAVARLAQVEAQLENLRKGRRQPEVDALIAQRSQAEAAAKLSETQMRRQERLLGSPAFVQERLDEAKTAYDRDRARIAELNAQIATARLAARSDEIIAAEATVEAARAILRQAEWRLGQRTLAAPANALVTDTLFVVGEYVPAGAPVVSLLPPENIKLRFFVPEGTLSRLSVGNEVSVRCDGCAAGLTARISFIAPQAEYTPPVIYSRETRTKLVYLIEARPNGAVRLNPGQPVDVRLPARGGS